MKLKKITLAALLCCIIGLPLFSESELHKSFSDFGIKTIGIYTQAYEDQRSDNFLSEYLVMQNNPMLSDPTFYKDQYCNFNLTTQPLTVPGYPLDGTESNPADETLNAALVSFLHKKGWKTEQLTSFETGTLDDLLTKASKEDLDAVLVVRYTPVTEFIPVENYRESRFYGSSGIITGKIKLGLAYYPALELYDALTGTRLWYSAYHSGHQVISKKKPFVENVAAAEEFFVSIDMSSEETLTLWTAAELTGTFGLIWETSDVDEKAADKMIELAMKEAEAPFPNASDSGPRNKPPSGGEKTRHMFRTDYPSYSLYGTKYGFGYTLDYIGSYSLSYQDETDSYPGGAPPSENALTIENLIMHKFTLPVYTLGFGNLSIDPIFTYGTTVPATYTLHYDDYKGDGMGSYTTTPTDDEAEIRLSSFSLEVALKYYLRFSDTVSAYIGGVGSIDSWWEDIDCEEAGHDEILETYNSLYVNYDADLLLNASVIAGVRFDSKNPFEIYAEYTPVGPGDGMMLSAGFKWLPFTWGWTHPHAEYLEENKYF